MISDSENRYSFSLVTIVSTCFLAVTFILAFASIADAHNTQSPLPALGRIPENGSGTLDSTRQVTPTSTITPTWPIIWPTTPLSTPCKYKILCPDNPKVPGGTDERFALIAALILAGYELSPKYSNSIEWVQPDISSGLRRDRTIDIQNPFILGIGLE